MPKNIILKFVSKILPLTLAAAFALPAIAQNDVTVLFKERRPTPCLDAVNPILFSQLQVGGAHSFLRGVGSGQKLGEAWAPGNRFYDQAFLLSYKALSENQTLVENISTDLFLRASYRHLSAKDLDKLRNFFASYEGQVYWKYMLDGASCEGLFEFVVKSGKLSPEHEASVQFWRGRFPVMKAEFEGVFERFSTLQKASFKKGHNVGRAPESEAESTHEMQFNQGLEELFLPAAQNALKPIFGEVAALVQQFRDSR
jgi:hypothetical protein